MKLNKIKKVIAMLTAIVTVAIAGFFCGCQEKPAPDGGVAPVPVPKPPETTVVNNEYKLHNWYAIWGKGIPTIMLTENNYSSVNFPVPEREGFTFDGWYMGEEKVADENGKSLMTKSLFESDQKDITAKFTANEKFTYKILLVFVTRIDAVLPKCDKTGTKHVDYTMRDVEREFCENTVPLLKETMDDMLDGLVDFQIDGYFTTEPAVTEYFRQTSYSGNKLYNSLFPEKIPEVQDKLESYNTVLSVFSMDDFGYELHNGSGAAWLRYGEVNFDSFLSGLSFYNDTNEIMQNLAKAVQLLKSNSDKKNYLWKEVDNLINTLIHETAHTIELRINCYDFDLMSGAIRYEDQISNLEAKYYYYKNEVLLENKKEGIPYKFWKGEIGQVTYLYPYDKNGHLTGSVSAIDGRKQLPSGGGKAVYQVLYGESITVEAEPSEGYIFEGWSDGIKTPVRTDVITSDLQVTAIFTPKEYKLTVSATVGGEIGGYGEPAGDYSLIMNGSSLYIQAIAFEGYRFVSWSDGETKWFRHFRIDLNTVKLFDENDTGTLTAIFEKIEE